MVKDGEKSKNNIQLFLGEYQPNITEAGRIALPKKIREILKNDKSVILSRGFEKCIFGYSLDQWNAESEKTLVNSTSDRRARMLKRYLFSGAYELDFDSQGRVVLPKSLLDYSNLEQGAEVILIGAGDHFEIWNKKIWEATLLNIENEIVS